MVPATPTTPRALISAIEDNDPQFSWNQTHLQRPFTAAAISRYPPSHPASEVPEGHYKIPLGNLLCARARR